MTIASRDLTVEFVGDDRDVSVGDDRPPVITVSAARTHLPERSLLGATCQQEPTFHASDARQTTGGGPITLATRMALVVAKTWATRSARRVAHTGAPRMAHPTALSRATTLTTMMAAVGAAAGATNGALAVRHDVDLVRGRLDRRAVVRDDGEHGPILDRHELCWSPCYDRGVSKTHTRPAWRGWGLDQIRSLPAS